MSTDQQNPFPHEHLHDVFEGILYADGTMTCEELVRRARLATGNHSLILEHLHAVASYGTALVLRPDGHVTHLADVLDGMVLTHRVRGRTHGRADLWLGPGVQPFMTLAVVRPLLLASGGTVELTDTSDDVLLGPEGWLPELERGELISLRWSNRELSVGTVATSDLPTPEDQEHARSMVAGHVDAERWYDGDHGERAGRVVLALTRARLEDPQLLSTPHPPLDEMFYDPLEHHPEQHWRHQAAARQMECVTFCIDGMPAALDRELRSRARQYGMTVEQFIIALLGHLAWRTPFAEDMEPWEQWTPDEPRTRLGQVRPLPGPTTA